MHSHYSLFSLLATEQSLRKLKTNHFLCIVVNQRNEIVKSSNLHWSNESKFMITLSSRMTCGQNIPKGSFCCYTTKFYFTAHFCT